MKERHIKLLSIFLILGGVLMHYQNCSQNSKSLDAQQNSENLNSDPTMRIINPVETGGIQFLESKTQLASTDQSFIAYGLCSAEQQGALLSWKLFDANENLISKGKSLCDKGAFEVVYQEAGSLPCDSALKLSAYFGSSVSADLSVSKSCP